MKLYRQSSARLNIRIYVLFTIYSAPFIDLLNGVVGNVFPIGKAARTCMLFLNLLFAWHHIPESLKRKNVTAFFIISYFMAQTFIIGIMHSGTLVHNLGFGMKVTLFLSEMILIMNCVKRRIITYFDIELFWKFSCWFIPLSLIATKTLNVINVVLYTRAGLYASVNAMSIIFVIQFVLSIYYAENNRIFWGAVLLNIVAAALLGTKSPYLFMVAVVLALFIFYSGYRIRLILLVSVGIALAYVLLGTLFANQMAPLIEYQKYYLRLVDNTDTLWGYLFSGRNVMLQNAWDSLTGKSLRFVAIIFGVGHSTLSGIEMDFFEILFSFGAFIAVILYSMILDAFKWKCINKSCCLFLNLALICMLVAGTLGGHTFLEAIAGTYSAILIGYKYSAKTSINQV